MAWWDDEPYGEQDAGDDPYYVHADDERFDPWPSEESA
jgi:hypothetical protein